MFENKLYIQTGKVKDVSNQIKRNPNVELCAFKDGKWIRVRGKLVLDDRFEAKKDMLDKNPGLRRMYSENDGNTEVYYFDELEPHTRQLIYELGSFLIFRKNCLKMLNNTAYVINFSQSIY